MTYKGYFPNQEPNQGCEPSKRYAITGLFYLENVNVPQEFNFLPNSQWPELTKDYTGNLTGVEPGIDLSPYVNLGIDLGDVLVDTKNDLAESAQDFVSDTFGEGNFLAETLNEGITAAQGTLGGAGTITDFIQGNGGDLFKNAAEAFVVGAANEAGELLAEAFNDYFNPEGDAALKISGGRRSGGNWFAMLSLEETLASLQFDRENKPECGFISFTTDVGLMLLESQGLEGVVELGIKGGWDIGDPGGIVLEGGVVQDLVDLVTEGDFDPTFYGGAAWTPLKYQGPDYPGSNW